MPFWIGYTGIRGEDVGVDPEGYPLPDGTTNRGRLNQTPKVMTANKAAAEVRHKIKRKINELDPQGTDIRMNKLRAYILDMAKRASAKKGGLG